MPSEFARIMLDGIYTADYPEAKEYQQWSKANNFAAILEVLDGLSDPDTLRHYATLLEENERWAQKLYVPAEDGEEVGADADRAE